jgi:hypothetical protein
MSQTPAKPTVVFVNRLTPDMMTKLEQELPKPVIGAMAGGEQPAYLLGIQFVLAHLRKGWVME